MRHLFSFAKNLLEKFFVSAVCILCLHRHLCQLKSKKERLSNEKNCDKIQGGFIEIE